MVASLIKAFGRRIGVNWVIITTGGGPWGTDQIANAAGVVPVLGLAFRAYTAPPPRVRVARVVSVSGLFLFLEGKQIKTLALSITSNEVYDTLVGVIKSMTAITRRRMVLRKMCQR